MNDNNVKHLFMITSLVNVNPGYVSVFTTEQRYLQTSNTIQSIRNKVPNAKIVVLEEKRHLGIISNLYLMMSSCII